jgi:hypothetical protein
VGPEFKSTLGDCRLDMWKVPALREEQAKDRNTERVGKDVVAKDSREGNSDDSQVPTSG